MLHDEDLVFIDIEKGNKATWAKESGVKTTFLSLSIPAQIRKLDADRIGNTRKGGRVQTEKGQDRYR